MQYFLQNDELMAWRQRIEQRAFLEKSYTRLSVVDKWEHKTTN